MFKDYKFTNEKYQCKKDRQNGWCAVFFFFLRLLSKPWSNRRIYTCGGHKKSALKPTKNHSNRLNSRGSWSLAHTFNQRKHRVASWLSLNQWEHKEPIRCNRKIYYIYIYTKIKLCLLAGCTYSFKFWL